MTADGRGEDVDDDPTGAPMPLPELPGDDLDVDLGATIIGGAETAEELRRLAEQARRDVVAGVDQAAESVAPADDALRQTMMGADRDLAEIRRITDDARRRASDAKAEANRPLTAEEESAEIRRITEAARRKAGRAGPVTPVGGASGADTVWYPNPNPFPAVSGSPAADALGATTGTRTSAEALPAAPAGFDLDAHRNGQLAPPATIAGVADAARPTPMSWIIGAGVAAAVIVGALAFLVVSLL